ncbi:MAG: MGMT family protein [Candidatus Woesearchaeota archaeon]
MNRILSKKVYNLVKKIPKGKITTYKEIAKALDTKSYRLIGKILSKNNDKNIPCHRVIMSNGSLGGYRGNKNNFKKKKLLEKEGIKIINNKIEIKKYLHKF